MAWVALPPFRPKLDLRRGQDNDGSPPAGRTVTSGGGDAPPTFQGTGPDYSEFTAAAMLAGPRRQVDRSVPAMNPLRRWVPCGGDWLSPSLPGNPCPRHAIEARSEDDVG